MKGRIAGGAGRGQRTGYMYELAVIAWAGVGTGFNRLLGPLVERPDRIDRAAFIPVQNDDADGDQEEADQHSDQAAADAAQPALPRNLRIAVAGKIARHDPSPASDACRPRIFY